MAVVLGEPRPAPLTLDHLTAPLMTCCCCCCLLGCRDALKYTHARTDLHLSAHGDAVTPVSPFSFFNLSFQKLNQPLLLSVVSELQFASVSSFSPSNWGGCVFVCLCTLVVQSPKHDGRGRHGLLSA